MVDSVSPLPPINARIIKTQVTEKNLHHQSGQQQKHSHSDEEIEDEVVIEAFDEEKSSTELKKKLPPAELPHNFDIEV